MMNRMIIFLAGAVILGCGVKSDPLPPLGEEKIGRGKPTFRKAAKNISIPTSTAEPEEDDEDENED